MLYKNTKPYDSLTTNLFNTVIKVKQDDELVSVLSIIYLY